MIDRLAAVFHGMGIRGYGNSLQMDFRPNLAPIENVPKVGKQSVAQIDHRPGPSSLAQPHALPDSRLEREMFARDAPAKLAGDIDEIACFRARSQNR